MSRYHALRVLYKQQLTDHAVALTLEVPKEQRDLYTFDPGQYVNVRATIGGEDVRRSYSICALPSDGVLRIGVKHVSGGLFSTYANETLKPGDSLEVMPPQGKFTLETHADRRGSYVFFAAGSGITPVISLIRHILLNEPRSEVLLFYGNKTSESTMFKQELEAIKNKYLQRFSIHYVMSEERQSIDIYAGRIDSDKCHVYGRIFFQPDEVDRYFICGPAPMIESLRTWLAASGVAPDRVAYELFGTPASQVLARETVHHLVTDPGGESKVTVHVDGLALDFSLSRNGKSILDASIAAGADVPFSCKGGVCCTCKAKLVEGEVDMDVVYGLEPDELKAGYILTCQAHPTSELVKVDYDLR